MPHPNPAATKGYYSGLLQFLPNLKANGTTLDNLVSKENLWNKSVQNLVSWTETHRFQLVILLFLSSGISDSIWIFSYSFGSHSGPCHQSLFRISFPGHSIIYLTNFQPILRDTNHFYLLGIGFPLSNLPRSSYNWKPHLLICNTSCKVPVGKSSILKTDDMILLGIRYINSLFCTSCMRHLTATYGRCSTVCHSI